MRRSWALLLLLAGCVPPIPDVPPLLDIGARACPEVPSLDAAAAAPLESDGKAQFADVDGGSACLRSAEGTGLYTGFRFAAGGPAKGLAVASMALGRTMMAPRVFMLDGAGRVVRQVGADSFLYRGGMLSTIIRVRPEEAGVVIASYPPAIGTGVSRIVSHTQVSSAMIGPAVVTWSSGSEAAREHTLAHNGRVRVELYLLPPAPP